MTLVELHDKACVEMMNKFARTYPWDWASDIGAIPPAAGVRVAPAFEALELLRQITALKQKQEQLHKGPFSTNQRALESLQAAEDARLENSVAFRGDESGISRERLEHIQCVLRNPRKTPSHLDQAKWMDVFRSQPWC